MVNEFSQMLKYYPRAKLAIMRPESSAEEDESRPTDVARFDAKTFFGYPT